MQHGMVLRGVGCLQVAVVAVDGQGSLQVGIRGHVVGEGRSQQVVVVGICEVILERDFEMVIVSAVVEVTG